MLLLLFTLLFNPSDHQILWDARLNRDSSLLDEKTFQLEKVGPGLMQDYLLTLGQIGNPADVDKIAPFLSHEALSDSAIFAYGEVDGAPLKPLLDMTPESDTGAYLWIEALAKLAEKDDHRTVVSLWRKLPLTQQHQTVGLLYRIKTTELQILVPDRLRKDGSAKMGNYVYYLMRSRSQVPQTLAMKLLDDFAGDGDVLTNVLRLGVAGATPELAERHKTFLNHGDWRVRNNALQALGRSDRAQAAQRAFGLLLDPNPNVVRTAIRQILGFKDPAMLKNLAYAASTFSPSQLQTLGNGQDPTDGVSPALANAWLKSSDTWQQLHGIRLLAKDTSSAATERLVALAESDNAIHAAVALSQLSGRKHDRLKEIAAKALESGDPYKMTAAVSLIGEDSELMAIANEAAAKVQPEADFHYAWIPALKASKNPAAKEQLEALHHHADYLVRLKAFQTTDGDVAQVFKGGWQHKVPKALTSQALEFAKGKSKKQWQLKTTKGTILIDLHTDYAPINCANIATLTAKGYFNDMALHRVVPNFVVQGGDPRGDGSGGPGHAVPCEINPHRFVRGAVGMALAGKDTGGSQFFICHSAQPHLDGGYTVFGKVVKGMNIVDNLEEGDRIIEARIR